MSFGVCILGSGSSGNAAIVETAETRLLIDMGFSTEDLSRRLSQVGRSFEDITHVLLTHTHGDHITPSALKMCETLKIQIFCHRCHEDAMAKKHAGVRRLRTSELIAHFEELPFIVGDLNVRPLELPHDDPAKTYGFVIRARGSNQGFKAGFVSDLGHVPADLVAQLADCDVLAIEHNYDAEMLWTSGRPYTLKKRIRGPHGHLSNDQGSQLLATIVSASRRKKPSHIFLTHLSRECNKPELAKESADRALASSSSQAQVLLTWQDRPTEWVWVHEASEGELDVQMSLW